MVTDFESKLTHLNDDIFKNTHTLMLRRKVEHFEENTEIKLILDINMRQRVRFQFEIEQGKQQIKI